MKNSKQSKAFGRYSKQTLDLKQACWVYNCWRSKIFFHNSVNKQWVVDMTTYPVAWWQLLTAYCFTLNSSWCWKLFLTHIYLINIANDKQELQNITISSLKYQICIKIQGVVKVGIPRISEVMLWLYQSNTYM